MKLEKLLVLHTLHRPRLNLEEHEFLIINSFSQNISLSNIISGNLAEFQCLVVIGLVAQQEKNYKLPVTRIGCWTNFIAVFVPNKNDKGLRK